MADSSAGKIDAGKLAAARARRVAEGKKAMNDYDAAARRTREKTERLKALREAREETEIRAKAKRKPTERKKRFSA